MTDAKSIHVVVITPERQVLEQATDGVVIPAHDGELGVLRDRAALVCELGIGQLRYSQAGQTWRVFIDGGFAEVLDNHVTVLTAQAMPAAEVTLDVLRDAERAVAEHGGHSEEEQAARRRAQRRLSELRRLARAQ